MLPRTDLIHWPTVGDRGVPEVLGRICVRPPYFALSDLALEGLHLYATAKAESPPYLELGPMPAAELGRHAAITGLAHAALSQRDDQRRYYLAQRAECRYWPSDLPYGSPVRFQSRLVEMGRREVSALVEARVDGQPLASFELSYAVLPAPSFERLFRHRGQFTPPAASPYGRLLMEDHERGSDWAEQRIEHLGVEACAGHFENYPALPVAVLMGQLSYLAGQLSSDGRHPFRVLRGSIEADDLAWAGESTRFLVRRANGPAAEEQEEEGERYECSAFSDERRVGNMTLWLSREAVSTATGSVAEAEALA